MKAFTDIEQSKKLAEILPIESADMCWELDKNCSIEAYNLVPLIRYSTKERKELFEKDKELIPCWSLAALLDVIPFVTIVKDEDGWYGECENGTVSSWNIELVDTCVDMILQLKEKNLI